MDKKSYQILWAAFISGVWQRPYQGEMVHTLSKTSISSLMPRYLLQGNEETQLLPVSLNPWPHNPVCFETWCEEVSYELHGPTEACSGKETHQSVGGASLYSSVFSSPW